LAAGHSPIVQFYAKRLSRTMHARGTTHPKPELHMGRVHPRVGLGRIRSNCVRLCGSRWMLQNVTLNLVNCY